VAKGEGVADHQENSLGVDKHFSSGGSTLFQKRCTNKNIFSPAPNLNVITLPLSLLPVSTV